MGHYRTIGRRRFSRRVVEKKFAVRTVFLKNNPMQSRFSAAMTMNRGIIAPSGHSRSALR
jgi:hypothetical protein